MDILSQYITLAQEQPGLVLFLLAWTMAWKGVALWKAARKESSVWFIALFLLNTLGILPILYIFIFSELGEKKRPGKRTGAKRS